MSPRVRRDDKAEIRARLNDPRKLAEELGLAEGAVRQGNGGLTVRCPAHGDRTPSCSITLGDDKTIRVKCMACEFSGDALTLIAHVRGLDLEREFQAVLEEGARLAGYELDRGEPGRKAGRARRAPGRSGPKGAPSPSPRGEGSPDAPDAAGDPFPRIAAKLCELCSIDEPDATNVRDYLDKRKLRWIGLDREWRALPASGEGAQSRIRELEAAFGREALIASGLVQRTPSNALHFVWPSNRLIIPWYAPDGSIDTLQRRTLTDGKGNKYAIPAKRAPRYPYGIEWFKPNVDGPIAFTEGALDAGALASLFRENEFACSVLGVPGVESFRPEWAAYARGRVAYVATDADKAGDDAAPRWAELLYLAGALEVRRLRPLHEGHDWAEYVERDMRTNIWTNELIERPADVEQPAGDDDARPVIQLIAGEIHQAIDQGIAALAAGDRELYVRETSLVHIVRATAVEPKKGIVEGTPLIRPLAAATLLEHLTRFARWHKPIGSKGTWTSTNPPRDVVEGILARQCYDGIRPINGIIETPVLRHDGTIITAPGYDVRTGYLYQPSRRFPDAPERPAHDDARAALKRIEELFSDFPYGKPSGRSVPIALILTLLGRAAIAGPTPAFLFDATLRGSGKSLQAHVAALAATGRRAAVIGFNPDAAELTKVLCGFALCGAAFVNFDNVDGEIRFGGTPLEMVLTANTTAQFRVLGTNRNPTLEWRTVIAASGNNITLSSDMERRALIARLEPKDEHPELRPPSSYSHPEWANRLDDVALERHPELVMDGLTILRAHALAGRPNSTRPLWGSYGAWTDVIANAIVWADGEDPLDARPTDQEAESDEKRALRTLVQYLPRLDLQARGLTVSDMVNALYRGEADRRAGRAGPDNFTDLREALEVLAPPKKGIEPDRQRLGYVLRRMRGRPIDLRKLSEVREKNGSPRYVVCSNADGSPIRADNASPVGGSQ